MKHVLLIDGSNLFCRVYWRRKLDGASGLPEHVLPVLKGAAREWKADYVLVALDPIEGRSFRYDLYPKYKFKEPSDGPSAHDLTVEMLPYLDEWGVEAVWNDQYEADDVIATLTRRFVNTGKATVSILSKDRDLFALVQKGSVRCLWPDKGQEKVIKEKDVFEALGVFPEQIPAFKMLAGDKSDNIPRMGWWDRTKAPYGFTEKRAAELLAQHGTLKGVYQSQRDERERSWLERARESLPIKAKLVKLVEDVPLEVNIEQAKVENLL